MAAGLGGCGGDAPPDPDSPAVSFRVRFDIDTAAARRPISPYVYGVNSADWNRHRGVTLDRLGGNRWTAYNWETNASNAGSDYRHQNDNFLGGGEVPGEAVRPKVAAAHAAGASMVVTVPMAGYVSADKRGDGDVNQTPDWLRVRFHESVPAKGRSLTYPPDTADRIVCQDEFVAWLESSFPNARTDPSRTIFYDLDNEPDLWASTHARIRPTGPARYDEMVERTIAWSRAIKDVAPSALVFGPVNYGWQGYVRLQNAPDAGGRDFLDFFLDSMREAEARDGRRLLDVLDVHWYPEARGGSVRITEADTSSAVVAARLQAPRSLWDPSYVETSWISQDARVGAIRLIPRLQEKIAVHYPGTKLAITEYNYGAAGHISGAVAQADVLGVFGREGVFAANWWPLGQDGRFADAAFASYRNYDGAGGRFGDTSVQAQASDVVATSVYASVDAGSDARVVVIAINKQADAGEAEIAVSHPVALSGGRTYTLAGTSTAFVTGTLASPTARNTFRAVLPGLSVTTIVLAR